MVLFKGYMILQCCIDLGPIQRLCFSVDPNGSPFSEVPLRKQSMHFRSQEWQISCMASKEQDSSLVSLGLIGLS